MRQKNVWRELTAQNIESGDRKPLSEPPSRNFLEQNFHLIKLLRIEPCLLCKRKRETKSFWRPQTTR